MVFFSFVALIFWIMSMMIYRVPFIEAGGLANGLLLIPIFILSVIITKFITNPLKSLFKRDYEEGIEGAGGIIGQLVILVSPINNGRLGQGEIKRDGASLLINVKAEEGEDSFDKGEEAYVYRKDNEKNIYYIIKIKEWM